MPTKFKNKYRIESTRLVNFDYSSNGAYFITICTKDREFSFGDIENGKLQETEQSRICTDCWNDLPNHYPNCVLDEFIIMPNHVHGIIVIENNIDNVETIPVETIPVETIPVETIHELSLQCNNDMKSRRQMLIPKIIGRFKMQSAKQINEFQNTSGLSFWQKGYYDRVIRNEKEFNRIRDYIVSNPLNWDGDGNNLWLNVY